MFAEFSLPPMWSKDDELQAYVARRIALIVYGTDVLHDMPTKRDDGGWDVCPSHNDWWLFPPHTQKNDTAQWRLCSRYAAKDTCEAIGLLLNRFF